MKIFCNYAQGDVSVRLYGKEMIRRLRVTQSLIPHWKVDLSGNEYIDCNFKHFESWEDPYWLHTKENWSGLVRYYEAMFSKYPDDENSQYYLGNAYVLNKEYEKAIQFIEPYYREYPETPNFYTIILDSLFALGKNENNFEWTEKPVIIRMSKNILDVWYKRGGSDSQENRYAITCDFC